MDLVFFDAVFWLLTNHNFKLLVFGTLTAIALFISFFHIIRKWGEY